MGRSMLRPYERNGGIVGIDLHVDCRVTLTTRYEPPVTSWR
jgi:hypothetical protein